MSDKNNENRSEVVSWEGVVELGHRVQLDSNSSGSSWISKAGYEYLNGFKCVRSLFDKNTNKVFNVTCLIYSSLLSKPLFQCLVKIDAIQQKFLAQNPTTVMKKIFDFTGVKPNRVWNGNHFLGLHRKALIKDATYGKTKYIR